MTINNRNFMVIFHTDASHAVGLITLSELRNHLITTFSWANCWLSSGSDQIADYHRWLLISQPKACI